MVLFASNDFDDPSIHIHFFRIQTLPCQETQWAAYKEVGDECIQRLPVGKCCEGCAFIALDVLMYDDYDTFAEQHANDKGLQSRVARIRANRAKLAASSSGSSSSNEPRAPTVTQLRGTIARIDKRCVAKTSLQLRRMLGTQRLAKEQVRIIPSIPLLETDTEEFTEDSDDRPRLWLFFRTLSPTWRWSSARFGNFSAKTSN